MIIYKIIFHIKALIQKTVLKSIYGRKLFIGKNTTWRKSFSLMIGKSASVIIGENCFFNNYCSINCHDEIIIGKNNLFGESVKLYDHNHVFNDKSYISEIWHHDGPCVPGMKKLFIDVNGDFYTCEKFVEDKKSSIGNLSHGFDLKKIEEYLNIGVLTENECKSCWASRFCNICALSCVNPRSSNIFS